MHVFSLCIQVHCLCLKLSLCIFKGLLECSSSHSNSFFEFPSSTGTSSCPFAALFVVMHYAFILLIKWDVPEGLTGPGVEGRHPQFPGLPAFIDGRVVAGIPRKNKCREPKKIPYAVPLFEPGTPSWSSCEYSSTPSVLSPEVEVTYPLEITIANI